MAYAELLRDLKLRRNWSDERLAHELTADGIDVSLDTVRSWVYGRRSPAERVRSSLDSFLKKTNIEPPRKPRRLKLGCRVTSGVLYHAKTRQDQKQIAVSASLGGAAAHGRFVRMQFGDDAEATVLLSGDSHAIWRQHIPPEKREFFDRLYHLLSLFPDKYLWFDCVLTVQE
jgi:hypothetical protein